MLHPAPPLTLRAATPDDALQLAELAILAAGEFYTWLYGPRAAQVLCGLFQQPGHLASYEKAKVATIEGQCAGMLLAFSWQQHQTEHQTTNWRYLRTFTPHTLFLVPLLFTAPEWFGQPEKDEFYVNYVAVYPHFQGRGLGGVLMQEAETSARAAGCRALSLDVDVKNPSAIRLYEKHGYAITKEATLNPFIDEIGRVYRMVKPLTASPA